MPFATTSPLSPIARMFQVQPAVFDQNWAIIRQAMADLQVDSQPSLIGMMATVKVECPPFHPIREYGGPQRFKRLYEDDKHKAAELGNTQPGDGARYCGRGFIQPTGRGNYEKYGKRLGIDLVGNPDQALEPNTAAAIAAAYWYDHNLAQLCEANNYREVRRRVNGGFNGLTEFLTYVQQIETWSRGSKVTL